MIAPRSYGLTARQSDALRFIRSHMETRNTAPSFQQIAAHLGLLSKSSVHRLLGALEERGHIKRLHNRARSIVLVGGSNQALSVAIPISLYIRATRECSRNGVSLDRYVSDLLVAHLPDDAPPSPSQALPT